MSDATSFPVKSCGNCKREISEANFLTHTVHCHRNIVLCKKCDTPFAKDEIDKHVEESHSKVSCTKCGHQVEQQTLEDHKVSKCSKRMVICNFCNIELPIGDRDEHLDYCGSRTERCDGCGQYVMAKFADIHLSSNHSFMSLEDATKPQKNKLNNVVDETVEVADPIPLRFNAGKRTNDMPQINLDREVQKNLSFKPVLQAAASNPTKLANEESDRLLAIQVAKEDAEESGDVFADNLFSDHHYEQRRGLFSVPPRSNFPDPLATPISTLSRLSQAVGTSINLLFPADSTSSRRDASEETEVVSLPCEFCGDLLPVDALLQHQATCDAGDADLGAVLNDELLLNNVRNSPEPSDRDLTLPLLDQHVRNAVDAFPNERNVSSTQERDFLIPCEYCNELYDASLIIEHQNLCVATRNETAIVNPRNERLQTVVRRPVLARDPDYDSDDDILRDAIAKSLEDAIPHPIGRPNRFDSMRNVRDVPIAVAPSYNPNLLRQAREEEIEKENALQQLRRLKAQLSNTDAPLVTSRRFTEPIVTQRNPTSDVRPNRDPMMGANPRMTPEQSFMLPGGTTPNYRRHTPNRKPPTTMNRRQF